MLAVSFLQLALAEAVWNDSEDCQIITAAIEGGDRNRVCDSTILCNFKLKFYLNWQNIKKSVKYQF